MYVIRIKWFIELVYKVTDDKCAIYLNDLITPKNVPINLRSENDMCIPQYTVHSFIYYKKMRKIVMFLSPFYVNGPQPVHVAHVSV